MFNKLYEAESDAVFRYCLFRVSDRETALDITQDTFMKFWDALMKGRDIKSGRAFLFTIAHNLVVDWYRKKKAVSLDAIFEDSGDKLYSEEDILGGTEDVEMTAEARFVLHKLDEVEPSYKRVLYLRFVEGLKPQEIARIMHLTANVVSVRITRGLHKLRQITGYAPDGSSG